MLSKPTVAVGNNKVLLLRGTAGIGDRYFTRDRYSSSGPNGVYRRGCAHMVRLGPCRPKTQTDMTLNESELLIFHIVSGSA